MFEHFSRKNGTRVLQFRLGYSIETRYGVLQEIAQAVYDGTPIPLAMGHASVIWQRDVAAYAIRSLHLADSPPRKLNITGPEIASVRRLAELFGERFGREPRIPEGVETGTAYVMDGTEQQKAFGFPSTTLADMVDMVSDWVVVKSVPRSASRPSTKQRDGSF